VYNIKIKSDDEEDDRIERWEVRIERWKVRIESWEIRIKSLNTNESQALLGFHLSGL
jgi:hypothetical protein